MPALSRSTAALVAALACAAIAFGACTSASPSVTPPAAGAGTLIVLNKAAASASLIDPATGATLATLPTGTGPHEVAVSPDGRLAVVTDYGAAGAPGSSLTVLDLAGRRVARTIDLAPLRRPHGIAWLPDSQRVLVTVEADSAVAVVHVPEGRVEGTVRTGQAVSHMLALSPDGAHAYVANIGSGTVTMLDVWGRHVLRTVPTGRGAEGLAVTPDGAELWVANREENTVTILDAITLAPLDTLRSGDFPIRVAFTPDGETALVTNARSGELRLFERYTRDTLATIAMRFDSTRARGTMLGAAFGSGTGVPIGILVAPDGRRAFIANANADVVTVVDLAARRIAGYLATGREPDGLGWSTTVRP